MSKAAVKPDAAPTTTAHFILQGKGGVGKSLVAALLAQYIGQAQKSAATCIDTDPVNATLSGYKGLNSAHLPLMDDGKIDPRKFDQLMEWLFEGAGKTFVIDNGAATFLPLGHYMAENAAYEQLADAGVRVITHCVVTGGQALKDTLQGLNAIANIAAPRSVLVWRNEYFGPVEYEGARLEELPVFKNNADKLLGVVTLSKRTADTFGADVNQMVSQHMTFDEALASPDFSTMARSRLRLIRKEVDEQLTAVGIL